MPIKVEFIEDMPITVYHYPEKLESNQDLRDALALATDHNRNLPDPVIWVIHNTSKLNLDFGTLVSSLVTLTKEGPEGFDDPRLRVAAVSGNELVKLAARSASQRQYGGWQVMIFDTYEEALAHAREDLARQKEA
ncbi:MAG: hypothetical protein JXB30_12500 [Anaerolineae bacterium]|nr:hypothetical protein [Anaerolineae bacterium]